MKKILNDLIGITGYTIKNKKYLYQPDENLIKSMKHFNINSVIDVGANKGQFAINLFKNKFVGDVLSFEPLEKEYEILKKLSKEKKNWEIEKRCALGNKKCKKKILYFRK